MSTLVTVPNTFAGAAAGSTLQLSSLDANFSSIAAQLNASWNGSAYSVSYGGTGLSTAPSNGQLLVGNGSTYTLSTLTAGTGIGVTNGAGSIALSNTGVTSIIAGTNIVISSASGAVQISSTGGGGGGGGTVTSIGLSGGSTGLTVSSSTANPIVANGTFTLGGTLAVANGGTGVTTSTGSGNNVLSTSPTLVTPILGTPTSVTLTNATGLPLTTGVTGTLAVANGGTGASTLTGYVKASGTSAFTASSAIPSSDISYTQGGAGAASTTVQAKLRQTVSVIDFGADNTGVSDCSAAFSAAIAAVGNGTVLVPAGTYLINNSIALPQNTLLTIKGAGYRNTFINFNAVSGFAGFNYARAGAAASGFVFDDLAFVWTGTANAANSRAIKSYGNSDTYSDNYLRCYRCAFYYFEAAIETKWSGQCYFVDCFFQVNTTSLKMLRGSSFFYLRGCMSFDATFIYAQDTTYDAFSNGLVLDNCNSITATAACMYVEGWQAVYIAKCGFDLGSGGTSALKFYKCTDGAISDCFVSSNDSVTRAGIIFDTSHTFAVRGCTIVDNSVGINILGSAGTATKIVVDGNKFDGNATNDVLGFSYATCCKIVNNHFVKQQARTGTDYEVYLNTTGTDYNIVQFNTFHGSSYVITSGANSIIGNNIFGCPAG
jgi:hypothetical protein